MDINLHGPNYVVIIMFPYLEINCWPYKASLMFIAYGKHEYKDGLTRLWFHYLTELL